MSHGSRERRPPQVLGIVGGVGSGKSWVSQEFGRLGAAVLDADRIGHEVLEEPDIRRALRARWGERIFAGGQRVDRACLAEIVFGPPPRGPEERRYLEQWTHPRIAAHLERRLGRLAEAGSAVAVLDAAVLLEAGWDRFCDRIVFVDVPRDIRLARCTERGWTQEQLMQREAAQLPLEAKRARADWVIDNSNGLESTRQQVEQIWYNSMNLCKPDDQKG